MGKKGEIKADIKKWHGIIKESKNSNWCKCIYTVSYNGAPANVDIRNVKFNDDGTYIFGKGISLTDEETDTTVDILLEKGYGTMEKISEAMKARNSMFKDGDSIFDDDYDPEEKPSKLVIDLPED